MTQPPPGFHRVTANAGWSAPAVAAESSDRRPEWIELEITERLLQPAEEFFLKGNGRRLGQGCHYGKPMSSHSFETHFPSARQVATLGLVDGQTHE